MSNCPKNIRYKICQIIRGCGTLPHVGKHPGTCVMTIFMMISIGGALISYNVGAMAAAIGSTLMAILMVAIYLFGAYSRAEDSDNLEYL